MFSRFANSGFSVLGRGFHKPVGIIGVPFNKGQSKDGVELGPSVLRSSGLIERLKAIAKDIDIKDYGDINYETNSSDSKNLPPNMKEFEDVAACNHEISKKVETIINDNRLCITLGGDHSIGIGSVDGHVKACREHVCILWIDAHADLNTNLTSRSGNIHGMPLAILIRELADYWPHLPGMDWQRPLVSIANVAYVGLRSVDPHERLIIERFGIAAYGMADVAELGVARCVAEALRRVDPPGSRSVHVSFDIDALDALEAPSTGTAVRGGLTLREGVHLMEMLAGTGRLGAVDLVEVNPRVGTQRDVERTVDAAMHILQAACGHNRRGEKLKDGVLELQTFPSNNQ